MRFFLRGAIYGLGFVASYVLFLQPQVEHLLLSSGTLYHPIKAFLMFTLGYWVRAVASLTFKRGS
jgi:hypothetical protein